MILVSLNVRGLNNIPRQKVFRRLIESQSLDVICIKETKLSMEGLANYALRIWPQGSW